MQIALVSLNDDSVNRLRNTKCSKTQFDARKVQKTHAAVNIFLLDSNFKHKSIAKLNIDISRKKLNFPI